jgi:glycosyltransferase involved in cell wall biosynthesis
MAVASRVGGNPELVRDGQTGLLFEPGNVQQLAGKLATLDKNEGIRTALAASGRDFVQHNFSREAALRAVSELYTKHLTRAGVLPN